ncbi:MAG: CT583 family protein [Parachlamydiaceae bacterium]
MSQVNALISKRLTRSEPSSKMAALAEKSASGNLSSFSGVFHVASLSPDEKEQIEAILTEHASGKRPIDQDLEQLLSITSEVKAINHQAALLHGERIQKAQEILKNYKDGAFTSWLVAVYGNRQTPYNLLHYFLFYNSIPKETRPQIEAMPRQAIYSIASRDGSLDEKVDFLLHNRGKRKSELLQLMRDLFPLETKDRRRERPVQAALIALEKALMYLDRKKSKLSANELEAFKERIAAINSRIKEIS